MTTECYWDYPLKGVDGCTENGSRKYREYYFDNNGDLTSQQVADHFGVKKSTIDGHRSNYKWDDVLEDKKAYEKQKRREKRESNYEKHIDADFDNSTNVLSWKYTLIEMAAIVLKMTPNKKKIIIPKSLDEEKAMEIIMKTPFEQLQKVIFRDLEQSYTKNDVQKVEGNINQNVKASVDLNNDLTAEELRDKDEAYIRQFING